MNGQQQSGAGPADSPTVVIPIHVPTSIFGVQGSAASSSLNPDPGPYRGTATFSPQTQGQGLATPPTQAPLVDQIVQGIQGVIPSPPAVRVIPPSKLGGAAKAVESVTGNVIMVGTFITTVLTEIAPHNATLAACLSVFALIVGATNSFRVWFVANEKEIVEVVESGEEMVQEIGNTVRNRHRA